jgi:RNA polymerase sigma-70 factor (ECF subfamily)
MLARLRPSQDVIAEVAQVLRVALFVGSGRSAPRIQEYAGRGSLRSWLRIAALREGLRILERTKSSQPIEEVQQFADGAAGDDVELAYMRALYGDAFRSAFRQAFSDLAPADQVILRQAYLEGMGIDRLGAELGVHRATAARRVARARSNLLESTRRALAADLDVDPSQIDSIIRLLGSQLEASVSALFHPGRHGG